MWRASDVIQAPVMIFDQKNRGLQAQSDASGRVSASFVQVDKSGKATPVEVMSDKLTYVETERKAVFGGNVQTRITGATIASEDIQVLLAPRSGQGNQVDKILASGNIQIQQGERRATGGQLVYSAQDKKFVLKGSNGVLPSIFDAEQGQITGNSLTFFTTDGRVLVESPDSTPNSSPSQTKNRDASKK
jgi:lipopolysaccharide export system protein LptA